MNLGSTRPNNHKQAQEEPASWSQADTEAALSLGWEIFQTDRDEDSRNEIVDGKPCGHRPFEIQAWDDANVFRGETRDYEAHEYVRALSAMGDRLALRAKAFLAVHSPIEHDAVFALTKVSGPEGPGVSIAPYVERLPAPRFGCAIFDVLTAEGEHLCGTIQGSGGRLGAGVSHTGKCAIIAKDACETLDACVERASKGLGLSVPGGFLNVYEPKPGHVAVFTRAADGRLVETAVPLVGTRFCVVAA